MIVPNPITVDPATVDQPPTLRRFSVEEYMHMHELSLFQEDERLELLDGEILKMSPIGPLHAIVVSKLSTLLAKFVDDGIFVSTQNPIYLHEQCLPQPDIVVFRYQQEKHTDTHIQPSDIQLLIEVANTSLDYDRTIKLPRYAEAGIPEVWIVDLEAQAIEQYCEPRGQKYGRLVTISLGEPIQASQLPGVEFTTDRIFS